VEEVTCCSRILVSAGVLSFLFFQPTLHAQRPSERYKSTIEAGRLEPRVKSFVAACLGTNRLPKAIELYSQGEWFVVPDLAMHMKEEATDDVGTAQVWEQSGKRAVSVWTHDDEFDRNTVACVDVAGIVTRQVNEYMPGLSEPSFHWISIRTFVRGADGKYRTSERYTDWNGNPIPAPKLNSEDRDFIAGERRYTTWKDFDFASVLERSTKP
jgi:hypothetical protein